MLRYKLPASSSCCVRAARGAGWRWRPGCVLRTTEWETAALAAAETSDIKLFGKWCIHDVQIDGICSQDYIAVKEKYANICPMVQGASPRHSAPLWSAAPTQWWCTALKMANGSRPCALPSTPLRSSVCSLVRTPHRSWSMPLVTAVPRGPNPNWESSNMEASGRGRVPTTPCESGCAQVPVGSFRSIKTTAQCLADELTMQPKALPIYAVKKDEWGSIAKFKLWSPVSPINLFALRGQP